MRRLVFLFSLLTFTQTSYGYSCPPPEFGVSGCEPKYFTLPQMEDTIHGLKGVTDEGRSLILEELYKRAKTETFTINLRIFSQELCRKGQIQGIDVYENGGCYVGILSYALYPGDEVSKLDGSLEFDIRVGPNGGFDGATVRGKVNF